LDLKGNLPFIACRRQDRSLKNGSIIAFYLPNISISIKRCSKNDIPGLRYERAGSKGDGR
jgi:hypothetical protein